MKSVSTPLIDHLKRLLDTLDSERGSLYYRTADEIGREWNLPRNVHLPPDITRKVTKEIKSRIRLEDRVLAKQQKTIREEIKKLKIGAAREQQRQKLHRVQGASSKEKSPRSIARVETRLGRCKTCNLKFWWYSTPSRRIEPTLKGRFWRGVRCPRCTGELSQTTNVRSNTAESGGMI